ncbi:MAG: hypothetical protein RSB23_01770 [Alistipes sp.]
MKRLILMASALLLFAVSSVHAQKINKEAMLQKMEKSNADIADAKKAAKASTWMNRGKIYLEAAMEPTKNLFGNMDATMLKLACGEPKSTEKVTLLKKEYTAFVYDYFTAYLANNKILAWKETQQVQEGAVKVAIDAYNKAFALDPNSLEKVRAGLKQISDFCSQVGSIGIDIAEYITSANAYILAFEAQSSPAYEKADPMLLYYAGYLLTVNGATDPKSYVEGAACLNKALDLGYVDEEGNIYYYLFHCYYGQKDLKPEDTAWRTDYVGKAKQTLLTGIEKFPKNERILDGLIQLYASEEGIGNPADLVTMIDTAIERDPTNVDLWFGRGRIFFVLKNFDESIASFKKVVELKPELFEGSYYLGMFYIYKGDDLNSQMNSKAYTSTADSEADIKQVNAVYREAIPCLEKAHTLKPEDINSVEYLKQLCYRFRDEEGMQDKYISYDALFKQMKGE